MNYHQSKAQDGDVPLESHDGTPPIIALNMRDQVAAFDWSSTPLGPREGWTTELNFIVEQVLDSGFPKAVAWGPSLITIYNDAFVPILGAKESPLGRPFNEIWAEAWDEIGPIAKKAFAGEATYIEDFPLVIERAGYPEQAYFTFCYSPLRLMDGTVGGMLDTVMETTATVRARENLALANQELAHRLKNTLAIAQALASQTFRHIKEQHTIQTFRSRLSALGQAHDVLLQQKWGDVSIRQAVESALITLGSLEHFDIDGPDLNLGSHPVMTISLVLHELTTNALKYGALSRESGKVVIRWQIDEDGFRFTWAESGGPLVKAPQKTGFGSRLIDQGFGSSSNVEREYLPEGMRLTIHAPMTSLAN